MTDSEIRELFDQARTETSLREAELNLVVPRQGGWVLLFRSRGEELAIEIDEPSGATSESMRHEIRQALMRLS